MQLKVDIADNPASLAKGLMGIKKLDDDAGMLFNFPSVIEASFWGKDTYIPLDIAFISSDNKIVDIKSITPMSTRRVVSSQPCIRAIEANSGFFRKNQICVGDSAFIEVNETDDSGMCSKATILFGKNV